MDCVDSAPQVRAKNSFSIENILSRPDHVHKKIKLDYVENNNDGLLIDESEEPNSENCAKGLKIHNKPEKNEELTNSINQSDGSEIASDDGNSVDNSEFFLNNLINTLVILAIITFVSLHLIEIPQLKVN